MIKRITTLTALCAAVIGTSGCFKNESKTTINKDGTGKFTSVMEFNLAGLMGALGGGGGDGKSPFGDNKTMLTEMVRSMTPYVDAFTEAKVETTKLGATKITVAGLTKDWTAMGDLKKAITNSSAAGQLPFDAADLPDMKLLNSKTDSDGNIVITFAGLDDLANIFDSFRKKAVKEGKGPKPGELKLTEDQVAQGIATAKEQYAQYKGMVAMFLKDVSIKSEIEVGGTIVSASGFKKSNDKTATFSFSGTQILELVDQILEDEELPGKVISLAKAVESGFEDGEATGALKKFLTPYFKAIYGGDANPKLVFKPGANAFNYSEEVAKAKAGQSAELKSLIESASKPRSVKLPGGLEPPAEKEEK